MNAGLGDGIADADYFTDTGSTPYAPLINKFAISMVKAVVGRMTILASARMRHLPCNALRTICFSTV